MPHVASGRSSKFSTVLPLSTCGAVAAKNLARTLTRMGKRNTRAVWTAQETARVCKVTYPNLLKIIQSGELPALDLGLRSSQGYWRLPISLLRLFAEGVFDLQKLHAAMRSELLFPRRACVNVSEAASTYRLSAAHVSNLARSRELVAIDIASGKERSVSGRHYWRVPTSALNVFLKERLNVGSGPELSILPKKPVNGSTQRAFRAEFLFPRRSKLYVHEVAKALSITISHALDLIKQGRIDAEQVAKTGAMQDRYRITSVAFDAFVMENTIRVRARGAQRSREARQ